MQQRTIIFTVQEDKVTNKVNIIDHDTIVGYEGENQATLIKFALPETWVAEQDAKYQICFRSADGSKYITDLLDEPEFALPSAVMIEGRLYIQVLSTDSSGIVIKKTEVSRCIVGASIVAGEVIASSEGLRHADKLMDDIDKAVKSADEARGKLEAELNAANVKLKDLTNKSIAFSANGIPLKTSSEPSLSGGALSASDAVVAYIPDYVTAANSGAFIGCKSLTDIYINQKRNGQHIVFADGSLPENQEISFHYNDDEDFADFRLYDCLVSAVHFLNEKISTTGSVVGAENTANKVNSADAVRNGEVNYPSINYINENCAEKTDITGIKANKIIAFDADGVPIVISAVPENQIWGAGIFTNLPNAKTVYIPAQLMTAQAGAFTNSVNITDMYINQKQSGQHITFMDGSLPEGNEIRFHYKDDDDFGDFAIIDCLAKSVIESRVEYATDEEVRAMIDEIFG